MSKSSIIYILLFVLMALPLAHAKENTQLQKNVGRSPAILTFKDCVAAGYPVMESYPRQCRTADGQLFISLDDIFKISKNVSCQADNDCQLVNEERGLSCCWAGRCQIIDYAQKKWVSVNATWFHQQRKEYCPDKSACGPAPMCVERIVNSDYTARCQNKECRKVIK